jgi:hypothetical protein
LTGVTGVTLLAVYIFHYRERRRCNLVAKPAASIAATGALLYDWQRKKSEDDKLSRAPTGTLLEELNSTEAQAELESKLKGWQFWLDERGKIIGKSPS